MNIIKLVVILSILVSSHAAALSNSESRTIKSAVEAYVKYEKLSKLSKECNNNDFMELVSSENFENIFKEKLQADLGKFKSIIYHELPNFNEISKAISDVTCPQSNMESALQVAYDEFDLAQFNFSISSALDSPLLSEKEMKSHFDENLKGVIEKEYNSAHTIAVGKLIYTNDVDEKYKKYFIHSVAKNKYTYFMEKGWKVPAAKYILAESWNHEKLDPYVKNKASDKLGTKYIFFINAMNTITLQIPIEDGKQVISLLGKEDWFWSGGDLVRK